MGESPVHLTNIIIYSNKKETMPSKNTSDHYADFGNILANFDAHVKIGQKSDANKCLKLCPGIIVTGRADASDDCFGEGNSVNVGYKQHDLLSDNSITSNEFGSTFNALTQDSGLPSPFNKNISIHMMKAVPWGTLNVNLDDGVEVGTKFKLPGSSNAISINCKQDGFACSDLSDILSGGTSWVVNCMFDKFECGLVLDSNNDGTYDKKIRVAGKTHKENQQFDGVLNYKLDCSQEWDFNGSCCVRIQKEKCSAVEAEEGVTSKVIDEPERRFLSTVNVNYVGDNATCSGTCRLEEDTAQCLTSYCEINVDKEDSDFATNDFCKLGCEIRYRV
jgi:hypothetical protein